MTKVCFKGVWILAKENGGFFLYIKTFPLVGSDMFVFFSIRYDPPDTKNTIKTGGSKIIFSFVLEEKGALEVSLLN